MLTITDNYGDDLTLERREDGTVHLRGESANGDGTPLAGEAQLNADQALELAQSLEGMDSFDAGDVIAQGLPLHQAAYVYVGDDEADFELDSDAIAQVIAFLRDDS